MGKDIKDITEDEYQQLNKWCCDLKEINKLIGLTKQKGYSLVPISIYFKGNFVKLELRNWER